MQSGAEDVLREFAEATNIPVVTSSGGKGARTDNHPLTYRSCLSPAAKTQELNQLFDVMQAADVMIGVGARFSIGNPAGESCTLININIDDRDLTRVQANTLPLHGDAKATLELLKRCFPTSKRRALETVPPPPRPSRQPADSSPTTTSGSRSLSMPSWRPSKTVFRRDHHGLGRHPIRLLLPHPLPGEPTWNIHRLWLLVQPRARIPHGPGREGREA